MKTSEGFKLCEALPYLSSASVSSSRCQAGQPRLPRLTVQI